MSESSPAASELLSLAQRGDSEALGKLLNQYRCWLQLFAVGQLSPALRRRVDESDLVQQTLLSAIRAFPGFHGCSPLEFQVWLKRIYEHNLRDVIRLHDKAACRSIRRERPFDEALEKAVSNESRKILLGERVVELAQAMESIPPDQREAVRLRIFEAYTTEQLEAHFQRSAEACAGLLKRGLRNLRLKLDRS